MSKSGCTPAPFEMDKKLGCHWETENRSPLFSPDMITDFREAVRAKRLSPKQAAEAIGIPVNTALLVFSGGTPKGARKIKAKVRAWLVSERGQA
ncbi:MAG: hypothetical protein RDV48_04525 [Candidatus Eremiobacteraeota bacterium]|nr:hypothetical protein [Candidatus Eremiobacteraeota bacterium]